MLKAALLVLAAAQFAAPLADPLSMISATAADPLLDLLCVCYALVRCRQPSWCKGDMFEFLILGMLGAHDIFQVFVPLGVWSARAKSEFTVSSRSESEATQAGKAIS